MQWRSILICGAALALVGCALNSSVRREPGQSDAGKVTQREASAPPARAGAYYKDDGPGASPPANLEATPDAVPRAEPLHKFANRSYTVFGRTYTPAALPPGMRVSGLASWYGRKFHGGRTASGEVYDMYAMTAAHPTLPIPSFARVTNLQNGRSAVVRVNDRGPFHRDRIIDLSYTAALKLGFVQQGSAWVEVEPIVVSPSQQAAASSKAPTPTTSSIGSPRIVADAGGHYIQLAAFRNAAGAESFHRQVAAQLEWLRSLLHISASDGVLRVRAGPYRSAAEASTIAQRVSRFAQSGAALTSFSGSR